MAKAQPQVWLAIFTAWLFFTFNFLNAVGFIDIKFFIIFIPLVVFFFINELYLFHKRPMSSLGYTFLGLIYIAIPFSLLNYFVFLPAVDVIDPSKVILESADIVNEAVDVMSFLDPNGTIAYTPYLLLGLFIQIWLYDTFAYIFGVWLGKHRLFERISPKKSWEGLIGGAVFTVGLSFFLHLLFENLEWYNWMVLGGITVITSTFGDLVESLFKRSLNVKDSGHLLPGHGGILDRFDSVLIAAPIAFVYLQSCF
jgi:phosphatidate cytidylyltransferase